MGSSGRVAKVLLTSSAGTHTAPRARLFEPSTREGGVYGKVFKSMFHGSLLGKGDAQLVFTVLIAHSDRNGDVEAHPAEIATWIGKPIEVVNESLELLMSDDPDSRSPEDGGRRITRGSLTEWHIVNYAKYRGLRDEDDRRQQNQESQQRRRDRFSSADVSPRQPGVSQESANVSLARARQGEGEGDVEAEEPERGLSPPLVLSPTAAPPATPLTESIKAIAKSKSKPLSSRIPDPRPKLWEIAQARESKAAPKEKLMAVLGWLYFSRDVTDMTVLNQVASVIGQANNPYAYLQPGSKALESLIGARAVERAEGEKAHNQEADRKAGLTRR